MPAITAVISSTTIMAICAEVGRGKAEKAKRNHSQPCVQLRPFDRRWQWFVSPVSDRGYSSACGNPMLGDEYFNGVTSAVLASR
jgi:hypothetical protein